MERDFNALAEVVIAYFNGTLPLDEAAQRVIDLGFADGFTIGAESPEDMEEFIRLGARDLILEVNRRVLGIDLHGIW